MHLYVGSTSSLLLLTGTGDTTVFHRWPVMQLGTYICHHLPPFGDCSSPTCCRKTCTILTDSISS